MAITDKWRQMMVSFADIAAAIVEMGGTLDGDGGYAVYAKGARSIFSSESYTPQYVYPAATDNVTEYMQNQLTFCGAVKEEIRQAIIAGGVACDTTVPLSQYGAKIRQISAVGSLEIADENHDSRNRIVIDMTCMTNFTHQFNATGGESPYTWQLLNSGTTNIFGNIDSTTGVWTFNVGTTSPGAYKSYTVTVTDARGHTVTEQLYISVSKKSVTARVTGQYLVAYDGQPHTQTFECVEDTSVPIVSEYWDGGQWVPTVTDILPDTVSGGYNARVSIGNTENISYAQYYTITSENREFRDCIKIVYMVVSPMRLSFNFGDTANEQLTVTGGVAPYTFTTPWGGALSSSGLSLSSSGLVYGTVNNASKVGKTYPSCDITVTDSVGQELKLRLSISLYKKTVSFAYTDTSHTYDGTPKYVTATCNEVPSLVPTITYTDRATSAVVANPTAAGTYKAKISVPAGYIADTRSDTTNLYINRAYAYIRPANNQYAQHYTYDGQPHPLQYTMSPAIETTITYRKQGTNESVANPTEVGIYSATIYSTNDNYEIPHTVNICQVYIDE